MNVSDTIDPNEIQGSCGFTAPDAIGGDTVRRFPIVAIGASAGGLEAFEGFFARMPPDSGMAFVLIQHLDPTHRSMLTELVAKFTAMPVHEIVDGMTVAPNNVYVIPPDRDIGILHGSLHLLEPPERRGLRHPIDAFFRSLALEQGDQAIGIVVSGTGTEGTIGLRDIKAAGGIVLVQNPESAKFNGMPQSAVSTGLADMILPIEEMPENLIALVGHVRKLPPQQPYLETEADTPDILKKILMLLRAKTGQDFYQYKRNTIVRRIDRRMSVHRLQRMKDYLLLLQHHPPELDTLFKELLIGVTSYFRDAAAFTALRETVIPTICNGRNVNDEIRVWVPACSTGEEAVSIALLLHERLAEIGLAARVQVFATDIDSRAISIARRGIYPAGIANNVPPELLEEYFVSEKADYRVCKSIRDSVIYAEQNFIKDPPFSRLDLISCRNVLIYMGGDLQKKVIPLFHYALKPNGFLFLGTSESIGDVPDMFSVVDRKMKIFQRKAVGQQVLPNLTLSAASQIRHMPPEEKTMESAVPQVYLPSIIEKLVLADFTPSCVLVNRHNEIVCIHGRTGKFLEPAPGTDTRNLVAMAREGLKSYLSTSLRSIFEHDPAAASPADIVCPQVRVKTNGTHQTINLRIRLLTNPPTVQGLALVVFEEVNSEPAAEQTERVDGNASPPDEAVIKIRELEHELLASRDYLRMTVEELETTNEELKSSNEELQSTNEELQSINEEHETSKEELQSVNEEVITVNSELEQKLIELSSSRNDMINLLASTEIATLFLDRNLSVKRFTPAVVGILNLIPTDVGRPLSDISGCINCQEIVSDARGVLNTLIPREKEANAKGGRWYKVRTLPYRTTDNVIDGVVITFIDITDQKTLEIDSRLATVVRDSNDAVTVVDFEGRVLAWNRGAELIYGLTESEAIGLTVYSIFTERQHEGLKRLLTRIAAGEAVGQFQVERELQGGKTVRMQVTATPLRDGVGRPQAVAMTERIVPAPEQNRCDASVLLKVMPMPVVVEGLDGMVIYLNAAAEAFFGGGSERQLVGRPAASLIPPDDLSQTSDLHRRCRLGETVQHVVGRRLVGDGSIRGVVLTLIYLPDQCAVATLFEEAALPVTERSNLMPTQGTCT